VIRVSGQSSYRGMACNCNQRPHSHSPDSVAMRRPCTSVDNVVSFPWRPEHWVQTWGDEHMSKVDPRGDWGGEAEACPGNGIWIAGRQRPATPCRTDIRWRDALSIRIGGKCRHRSGVRGPGRWAAATSEKARELVPWPTVQRGSGEMFCRQLR
jgi:hypothetical protein